MQSFKNLINKIEAVNRRHGLLRKGDRIVVGLSGGPDSVALLHLLKRLENKYSLKLVAAWLDHGLQNKSQRKKSFQIIKKNCEALKITLFTDFADIKKIAKKNRHSWEEEGRHQRYSFFERVARKARCQKIATAHTLDDQAETVLLRIIRGTGVKGLSGIAQKRKQGRFVVIRPLLGCEKKELLGYLKDCKILFWKDPSNKEIYFTRNRVRHVLLPLLEKRFNPSIKTALANLQAASAEALLTPRKKSSIIKKH